MEAHVPKKPSDEVLTYIDKVLTVLPEEGLVLSRNGQKLGSVSPDDGRTRIGILGRTFMRHHIIWYAFHKKWPEHMLDHEDRNKGNDKIGNLRYTNSSLNGLNRDPKPPKRPKRVPRSPWKTRPWNRPQKLNR